MSDYENYLKQQQAERGRVYNDMTLDERLAEFIEYCQQKTERYLVIDAHMEIFNLRDENTRLDDALAATAAELTDATAQINELNAENNLLHDALTKLQARYDETEASLFQHLREKESTLAELEAARDIVNYAHYINSQLLLHQHGWIEREFSTAFLSVHKNLTRLFEKMA